MAPTSHSSSNRSNRTLRTLAALALALVVAACAEKTPEQLMQSAKERIAKNDLTGAVVEIKTVLQKAPKNGEARFLLGQLYNQFGEFSFAEKELRTAQELGVVQGGLVTAELGHALVGQYQYKKTLEEIKTNPSYTEEGTAGVHTARGDAYLGLRQADAAREAYAEALKARPNFPPASLGVALLTEAAGDREGALALIDGIVAKSPRFYDAWVAKADLLRRLGKPEDAVLAYGKAIDIRPGAFAPLISRTLVLVTLNRPEAAQKDVDALRKINRTHPLGSYLQALIYFRQNKLSDAQSTIQAALQNNANYLPALLLGGAINYAAGSFGLAEQYLSRVVAASPGNAYARKLLASTLVALNQGDRARETIKPLVGSQVQDWVVLSVAGSAEMALGNYAAASEYLEKAVAEEPKNPWLRQQLGVSHLQAGDIDRAVADLEQAAGMGGASDRPEMVLAIAHLRGKAWDKALQTIEGLEKKNPKNPLPYNLKGLALLGKNDVPAARKAFEQALAVQPTFFPAAMNLAKLDIFNKDPGAAQKRFEGILAKDKNHLETLMALAKLMATAGRAKQSVEYLERARQGNPQSVEPRIQLAGYYMRIGQSQRALVYASEAEKIQRDNPTVLDVLATAQLAAGEKASAVETYKRLVKLQPSSVRAHVNLAVAYGANKDFKSSESELRAALKLKPDDPEAMAGLVTLLGRQGRSDEALKLAREFKRLYPKESMGAALEADIFIARKDYAAAAKAYGEAYEISRNSSFAVKRFMAQVTGGDRNTGFKEMGEFVAKNPQDALARKYLADGLLSTGQYKSALEHYQVLVKASPDDAMVHNNLALIYQNLKDPHALESAEHAYKLAPANPLIGDTLGWLLVEQGKAAQAVPYLEKAIEKAPDIPVIRYHLAVARAKAGDKVRARRELEQLIASGKKFREMEEAKAFLRTL